MLPEMNRDSRMAEESPAQETPRLGQSSSRRVYYPKQASPREVVWEGPKPTRHRLPIPVWPASLTSASQSSAGLGAAGWPLLIWEMPETHPGLNHKLVVQSHSPCAFRKPRGPKSEWEESWEKLNQILPMAIKEKIQQPLPSSLTLRS
uniref:Uncharacterized protein n=1 Tax=Colobus angolensis palliatus TaxID=336983 RepID=A0A2K5J0Q2_COLAP